MKQLVKSDNYIAEEDPLLNYLVDVSNHFWLNYDPHSYTVDKDGNKKWGCVFPSLVPEQFADRFFAGCINTDREQKYLASEEVLATLKAFNLDADKFWYLCLAIKDVVEGYTDGGIKRNNTPRTELKALEDELDKLEPEVNANGYIRCKGKGTLTLKVGKHPIKITNTTTLSLINLAIHNLLEKYEESNNVFDTSVIDFFSEDSKVTLKPIYKIVFFYRFLSWFLKDKKADKAIYASKDKNLLISRMIFILGISDDESFFEEYKEDGSKLDYLKNYIKKYKDVEIPTHQNHYLFQGDIFTPFSTL